MSLRKAAKGKQCEIRVPGYCLRDPQTVTLAHYRLAGMCGVGMKPPDELAAHSCEACHSLVDGRLKSQYTRDQLRLWHAEGVMRTWMSRKCE